MDGKFQKIQTRLKNWNSVALPAALTAVRKLLTPQTKLADRRKQNWPTLLGELGRGDRAINRHVVAFPGGGGTKDMVRRAAKAGLSIHEVNRADDW